MLSRAGCFQGHSVATGTVLPRARARCCQCTSKVLLRERAWWCHRHGHGVVTGRVLPRARCCPGHVVSNCTMLPRAWCCQGHGVAKGTMLPRAHCCHGHGVAMGTVLSGARGYDICGIIFIRTLRAPQFDDNAGNFPFFFMRCRRCSAGCFNLVVADTANQVEPKKQRLK